MSPVKRYLLIFFIIYIGGGIIANVLLGPPGYSRAYRDVYHDEHEAYIEVVKSDEYKRWKERPGLNELDPASQEFVAQYESRPEFIKENHRQAVYHLFFDFFLAIMVVTLAVHFGRAPLAGFLDEQIAGVREKIQAAQSARDGAADRKRKAAERVEGLPSDKERIAGETDATISREQAELVEMGRLTMARIDRETEDRKLEEEHAAAQLVKSELVAGSIDALVERYKAEISAEAEAAQIDTFIRDVEARA